MGLLQVFTAIQYLFDSNIIYIIYIAIIIILLDYNICRNNLKLIHKEHHLGYEMFLQKILKQWIYPLN